MPVLSRRAANMILNNFLGQRRPITLTGHAGAAQVAMLAKAAASGSVKDTYRRGPPLVAVTCPFHSDRWTQSALEVPGAIRWRALADGDLVWEEPTR
jgi:hypothetical protein